MNNKMLDTKLLRQKILDLAIRGKLVPQDPDDEPASVLLKRICVEKEESLKQGKVKKKKQDSFIYTSENLYYENVCGKVTDITDQIPFEIPQGWAWVRLESICTHNAGKTLDKSKNTEGRLLKYITTSNLYWDSFVLDDLRSMFFVENEIDKCTAIKGDLLICEGGDAGRSAIWNYDYPICFQNHIHRVRFFGNIKPEYIILCLERFVKGGDAEKHKKGIGIQNISGTSLGQMLFPLPPLAEQRRIIEKFSCLSAQVNYINNEKSDIVDLAALAKSKILDLAIRGKLVPQDPTDEPVSELLARVSTSYKLHYAKFRGAPSDLPYGWAWTNLKNVCWLENGNKQNGEKLPYLEARYLRGKIEAELQDGGIILNAGDKVILITGENSGEVFNITERGYMCNTFRILKHSPAINAEFLHLFLDFHRKMFRDNKIGTAIPRLNKKIFESLPIAVPPRAEQMRIVAAIWSIVKQLDLLK